MPTPAPMVCSARSALILGSALIPGSALTALGAAFTGGGFGCFFVAGQRGSVRLADAMRTNPPLERRWTAHPRRRQSTPSKPLTKDHGTQTPAVQTLQGHAERHQELETKARSFAMTLEPASTRRIFCKSACQSRGGRKLPAGRSGCHGQDEFHLTDADTPWTSSSTTSAKSKGQRQGHRQQVHHR